jgi:hypothetical protein
MDPLNGRSPEQFVAEFFSIGPVPGVVATVVFALPPWSG